MSVLVVYALVGIIAVLLIMGLIPNDGPKHEEAAHTPERGKRVSHRSINAVRAPGQPER